MRPDRSRPSSSGCRSSGRDGSRSSRGNTFCPGSPIPKSGFLSGPLDRDQARGRIPETAWTARMEKPASPVSSSAPVSRHALRWSRSALIVLFGCLGPGPAEAHTLPVIPQTVWFSWGFPLEVVLPLLLVWWLYGRGLIRLWSRAGVRGVRPHRVACFAAGCASLVAALVSPLDAMAGALASAHMAQHLILLAVAPPLLLLGQPEVMLLWAMPASHRGPIGHWFRGRRLRSLFGWLAGPRIAAILHGIAIWGWHMPALYEIALQNPEVHIAEHATFLGTGLLYWHGLVQATRPTRGGQGPAILSAFDP